MKNTKLHIACISYAPRVARLLEFPVDHPMRVIWDEHAENCAECRELLRSNAEIVARLETLPDPGPALVQSRVMTAIKRKAPRAIFRRGDLAWGFATGVAGVALGFVLRVDFPHSNVALTTSVVAETTEGVADSFDQFAFDLIDESGELR